MDQTKKPLSKKQDFEWPKKNPSKNMAVFKSRENVSLLKIIIGKAPPCFLINFEFSKLINLRISLKKISLTFLYF